jgi:hypothetical protein
MASARKRYLVFILSPFEHTDAFSIQAEMNRRQGKLQGCEPGGRRGGPFVAAQGKLYYEGTGSGSRAVRPVRRTGRDLVPVRLWRTGTDGLLAPLPSQRTREKPTNLQIDCQLPLRLTIALARILSTEQRQMPAYRYGLCPRQRGNTLLRGWFEGVEGSSRPWHGFAFPTCSPGRTGRDLDQRIVIVGPAMGWSAATGGSLSGGHRTSSDLVTWDWVNGRMTRGDPGLRRFRAAQFPPVNVPPGDCNLIASATACLDRVSNVTSGRTPQRRDRQWRRPVIERRTKGLQRGSTSDRGLLVQAEPNSLQYLRAPIGLQEDVGGALLNDLHTKVGRQ